MSLLSALTVWRGESVDPDRVALLAKDLEARVLRTLTGTQDHLAALHGGVSAIRYDAGGPSRTALGPAATGLEARGLLFYLGASRASARPNWDMVRRALEGDQRTLGALAAIAGIAGEMVRALESGELDAVATLLAREWEERRRLSPAVSTPETERALEIAGRAGATGGKICGAGGGGALFVMAPPGRRDPVRKALVSAGFLDLAFRVDAAGLRVREEPAS